MDRKISEAHVSYSVQLGADLARAVTRSIFDIAAGRTKQSTPELYPPTVTNLERRPHDQAFVGVHTYRRMQDNKPYERTHIYDMGFDITIDVIMVDFRRAQKFHKDWRCVQIDIWVSAYGARNHACYRQDSLVALAEAIDFHMPVKAEESVLVLQHPKDGTVKVVQNRGSKTFLNDYPGWQIVQEYGCGFSDEALALARSQAEADAKQVLFWITMDASQEPLTIVIKRSGAAEAAKFLSSNRFSVHRKPGRERKEQRKHRQLVRVYNLYTTAHGSPFAKSQLHKQPWLLDILVT